MGHGASSMGHWAWGIKHGASSMERIVLERASLTAAFFIPNAHCPLPIAHCPLPIAIGPITY
ncbi:MAG: hypothetical protein KME31_10240 [Tolypothrix carrinoi HA7290-LM1]|nr:hypothetical protein [Tolypothrix carrinoi HA7290-LM1]